MGTEEHGLCCFGVTVPEALMKLLVGSCQLGNQVVFKKGCLYLYSPDSVFVLELDVFEQTELKIPVMTALEEADGVQTAVDELLLYQELERMAETLELGLERDALFYQYARVLESAKRAEELKDAIRFFVGRGQGLTPGGDDILTGYGAVLQAFGEADLLVQILKDMSADTTDVSRAYLTAMMEGYANETFCHIILQIFCKEVLKLRELLCRIGKIGNTSGRDTLYGMYLGLRKIKEAYIV